LSEEKTKSYVDVLKNPIKVEDNMREEHKCSTRDKYSSQRQNQEDFSIKMESYNQVPKSFFGYCYSCNGFGHKSIDCRINEKGSYMRNNNKYAYGFSRRNYNSFSPLLNYNIICYNCNNYGHIEKFCRSVFRKDKKEETPTVMEIN
jgi:hypothetical protein